MSILIGVNVVPLSNIAGTHITFDFFFAPATTGTIRTIEIDFTPIIPHCIDPSLAIVTETSGIGYGSIVGSLNPKTGSSKLTYTVSNPLSIAPGTHIKLEVARLFAKPGAWFANITTKSMAGDIIDGPTKSPTFSIISIKNVLL
jgi:hypothetical protein